MRVASDRLRRFKYKWIKHYFIIKFMISSTIITNRQTAIVLILLLYMIMEQSLLGLQLIVVILGAVSMESEDAYDL